MKRPSKVKTAPWLATVVALISGITALAGQSGPSRLPKGFLPGTGALVVRLQHEQRCATSARPRNRQDVHRPFRGNQVWIELDLVGPNLFFLSTNYRYTSQYAPDVDTTYVSAQPLYITNPGGLPDPLQEEIRLTTIAGILCGLNVPDWSNAGYSAGFYSSPGALQADDSDLHNPVLLPLPETFNLVYESFDLPNPGDHQECYEFEFPIDAVEDVTFPAGTTPLVAIIAEHNLGPGGSIIAVPSSNVVAPHGWQGSLSLSEGPIVTLKNPLTNPTPAPLAYRFEFFYLADNAIPTTSHWGTIVMALSLLTAATLVYRQHRGLTTLNLISVTALGPRKFRG